MLRSSREDDGTAVVTLIKPTDRSVEVEILKKKPAEANHARQAPEMLFIVLAAGSILSAIGFSALQEWVFKIPGFSYGGWMTFITYLTYAVCGWIETAFTQNSQRHGQLRDYALVSLLAMGGAYFTNWALEYLNYTTRIVFKSCRVLPVMGFRTLVVGQRYTTQQYVAGFLLVCGMALFTMGDAESLPSFSGAGIALISLALICDALTANLEERQFFRIPQPCSHSEVMLYLSTFAAAESFVVLVVSGEIWDAVQHSLRHRETVPSICAFSVLGYVTVCLILLIIKSFGATNAEIVKSLRKVFQVAVSFTLFPKVFSIKYLLGGLLVVGSLFWLQRAGKRAVHHSPSDVMDAAIPVIEGTPRTVDGRITIGDKLVGAGNTVSRAMQGDKDEERP
jgi:adenosine 3'-phospho 5'-phosphosulfate transporter B3